MEVATTKAELLQAIQAAIRESGLSLRAISEQTGISKTHIHEITQDNGASLEVLLKLADHFGIAYRIEGPKKR